MDDDDVAAGQVVAAWTVLHDELTEVGDELEVERPDTGASRAGTGRLADYVVDPSQNAM